MIRSFMRWAARQDKVSRPHGTRPHLYLGSRCKLCHHDGYQNLLVRQISWRIPNILRSFRKGSRSGTSGGNRFRRGAWSDRGGSFRAHHRGGSHQAQQAGIEVPVSALRWFTEEHGGAMWAQEKQKSEWPDGVGVPVLITEADGSMLPVAEVAEPVAGEAPVDPRETPQV